MADNIRQGGVCCICVKYCVRVGLGLRVVLGVDRIRVVSESNSCTWASHIINEGSTTRVTYDDLIATGTQGEPVVVSVPRAVRVAVSEGRSVRSHAPQI